MQGNFKLDYQTIREATELYAKKAEGLVAHREVDLLRSGERLQEFWVRSSNLAQDASEVAAVVSGERIESATNDLRQELDELNSVCTLGSNEDSLVLLRDLLEVITGLDSFLAEFKRIVRSLQMLGISTRIESARLGNVGGGFLTLADDVDKLANKIVDNSASVGTSSSALRALIHQAIEKTHSVSEAQESCSRGMFQTIYSKLEELTELTNNAQAAAEEVKNSTQIISSNMGEVVSGMQFHDIVRQQIEHVQSAFSDVANEAQERFNSDPEQAEVGDFMGFAADVSELQLSQLKLSSDNFTGAMERVGSNLSGVAESINAICGQMRSIVIGDAGDEESVIERIETGIANVMQGIHDFSSEGEGVAEVMQTVVTTVSSMAGFVTDIEEVGSEIELIALNASIKAAHTGNKGAALGVLAEAIQSLSVKAREQTEAVSRVLVKIEESSDVLRQNTETYIDKTHIERAVERFNDLTQLFQSLNSELDSEFGRLASEGDRLALEITRAASDQKLSRAVAKDIDALIAQINTFIAFGQEVAPHARGNYNSPKFREMLERYTMQTERKIHAEMFGLDVTDDADGDEVIFFDDFGSEPDSSSDSDGFDDNIELF